MSSPSYLIFIRDLLNFETYSKFRQHIKLNKDNLNPEVKTLYTELDLLMNTYQKDLTLEEFTTYVLTKHPRDPFEGLLKILSQSDVSSSITMDSLGILRERELAYQLANICLDVNEGKRKSSDILDFVSKFDNKKLDILEELIVNLDDLTEEDESLGLRWRLNILNRSLGSLRKGDFGFIFARPETGKTTFLASEVSRFAEQTTGTILWFNNEEQGSKVLRRVIQASTGRTIEAYTDDPTGTKDIFLDKTNNNIKIVDSAGIYKSTVEQYCKHYTPSLIVFDQIDKIKGFEADRNDLRLGAIYQWARELAKTYCPIIGVCQADGTGEGKKWLTMDNVSDSKTAKQAEADFIIGIGKTHNDGFEYIRHINISKNKLRGDKDSDPTLRHGKFDVIIEPQIARYKDIE